MARNLVTLTIPCHRVLAAGGKIGGFSAPGGSAAKIRMLAREGVDLETPPPAQAAGARTIRAGEFFTGPLSTTRQAGEIITELHLPFWPGYRRWAFEEFGPHDAVPIGKFLAP